MSLDMSNTYLFYGFTPTLYFPLSPTQPVPVTPVSPLSPISPPSSSCDITPPVNGIRIKNDSEFAAECRVVTGDIDASSNCVTATPQAREEISRIPNIIGDYMCRLCSTRFEDAFLLAQHRCPRIVYVEYRCPECSKTFNCPANLASHRRWHRPKGAKPAASVPFSSPFSVESLLRKADKEEFVCHSCKRSFRRRANLRKHMCSIRRL